MNKKEFEEKYCIPCGTQRCEGVDSVYAEGCYHYGREFLGKEYCPRCHSNSLYFRTRDDGKNQCFICGEVLGVIEKKVKPDKVKIKDCMADIKTDMYQIKRQLELEDENTEFSQIHKLVDDIMFLCGEIKLECQKENNNGK